MIVAFLFLFFVKVKSQCSTLQFGQILPNENPISAVIFEDIDAVGTSMGAMVVGGSANFSKWNAGGSLSPKRQYALLVFGELMIDCGSFHGNVFHMGPLVLGGRTQFSDSFGTNEMDVSDYFALDLAKDYYSKLSSSIRNMRGIGIQQSSLMNNNGVLDLYGTSSEFDWFQVRSSELCAAKGLQFHQLKAASVTTVIIDVLYDKGQPCYSISMSEITGFPFINAANHLLWNFYHEGDFKLTGELVGSLLAPLSVINSDGGLIEGQLIAKSVHGTIFLTAHWFIGCIPRDDCFFLSSSCKEPEIPEDCIDPTFVENIGSCCPNVTCAASCDVVPCPEPILCGDTSYVPKVVLKASGLECCDVWACVPSEFRTSIPTLPVVLSCPEHISVTLPNIGANTMHVSWDEPKFLFNANVKQNYRSGNRFPAGRTVVHYIAEGFKKDTTAACYFIVEVKEVDLKGACVVSGEKYENGEWIYNDCMEKCVCRDGKIHDCRRVRHEFASMGVEARTNFVNVFIETYNSGMKSNNGLVGLVQNHLQFFSRGLHNSGSFLPWHRGFLFTAEEMFVARDCTASLPYWDWSMNPRVQASSLWGLGPHQISGTGAAGGRCVNEGPFGFNNGFTLTNGRCLQRRISGGSAATASYMEANLFRAYPNPSQYDSFRNRLEHGPGMHDSIHCIVGGSMCSARSSNDPVFWLHHAMIDFMWVKWQKQSDAHLMAYTGNVDRHELMTASKYTPLDVLDYKAIGRDGMIKHVVYFEESEYSALRTAIGLINNDDLNSVEHMALGVAGTQIFTDMNMSPDQIERIRAEAELANEKAVEETKALLNRRFMERKTGMLGLESIIDDLAEHLAGKWLDNDQTITAYDLFHALAKHSQQLNDIPPFMEIRDIWLEDIETGEVVDIMPIVVPVECAPSPKPVCADGRTFDNECVASQNGFQFLKEGDCLTDINPVPQGTALPANVDGGVTDAYGHEMQENSECPDRQPVLGSVCNFKGLTCHYGLYCCEVYAVTATCVYPQKEWVFEPRVWNNCDDASSCGQNEPGVDLTPEFVKAQENLAAKQAADEEAARAEEAAKQADIAAAIAKEAAEQAVIAAAKVEEAAKQAADEEAARVAKQAADEEAARAKQAADEEAARAEQAAAHLRQIQEEEKIAEEAHAAKVAAASQATATVPSQGRLAISVPAPTPAPTTPTTTTPAPTPAPTVPPQPSPRPLPAVCPLEENLAGCPNGGTKPLCCPPDMVLHQDDVHDNFGRPCGKSCWFCVDESNGAKVEIPKCCQTKQVCKPQPDCILPEVSTLIMPVQIDQNRCCPVYECQVPKCDPDLCPIIITCVNSWEVAVPKIVDGVAEFDECCPVYHCVFDKCDDTPRQCAPGVQVFRSPTASTMCGYPDCPKECPTPSAVRKCKLNMGRISNQKRNPVIPGNPDSCKWIDCPDYEPCDDPLFDGMCSIHGMCIRGRTVLECRCNPNYSGARCEIYTEPPRPTFSQSDAFSFLMPESWACTVLFCCNSFCFIAESVHEQLSIGQNAINFKLIASIEDIYGQIPGDMKVYLIDETRHLVSFTPTFGLKTMSRQEDIFVTGQRSSDNWIPAINDFSNKDPVTTEFPGPDQLTWVLNAEKPWTPLVDADDTCNVKVWLTTLKIVYFNDAHSLSHGTCAENTDGLDVIAEELCANPCIVDGNMETCSGNGFCVWQTGRCKCNYPYTGEKCELRIKDAETKELDYMDPNVVYLHHAQQE